MWGNDRKITPSLEYETGRFESLGWGQFFWQVYVEELYAMVLVEQEGSTKTDKDRKYTGRMFLYYREMDIHNRQSLQYIQRVMDKEVPTSMNIIVKMKFGSHLYGTSTADSDTDYKGVFLPFKRDLLLSKIPKSFTCNTKKGDGKNEPGDVDTEIYSLHYFIRMACEGQTVALDMLHAPDSAIVHSSFVWDKLVANREKFYTKNLKAFVGYARKQAAKYGIKGSRLNAVKRVLCRLDCYHSEELLSKVWGFLPMGEHIVEHPPNANGQREYEVCGRKVQETVRVGYAMEVFGKFYKNYGERARKAANNEGIDWKAVSHALRAAFQVKQILTEKTITFPLREAEYLRDVKQGKLDYQSVVAPRRSRCLWTRWKSLQRRATFL
jgi:predicted nucleotidyltransferase